MALATKKINQLGHLVNKTLKIMENPIPKHFTELQHAFNAGLRIAGLYFRPVDFDLMWEIQKAFSENSDLTLMDVVKIEIEVRAKYGEDGVKLLTDQTEGGQ